MKRKQLPQARDFMTCAVHTVSPEMSLAEVIDFLDRHEVSNAPVVEAGPDGRETLVGFLSEGDCLDFLSNEIFFGSPAPPQTARTIMKRHPICVAPDEDIFTLASIFVNHRHRHLPVVEEGRLAGIVSRRDILKALNAFYREAIHERDLARLRPNLHEIINLRFVSKAR